jgi:hypothetical protein
MVFTIRDHAHLVSTMQEHILSLGGSFFEDEVIDIGDAVQCSDPLPFKGDSELYPPLAWTWMYRVTCNYLYGFFIFHEVPDAVRRWGYVMWDAARLECTGAKEVLTQQLDLGDSDLED